MASVLICAASPIPELYDTAVWRDDVHRRVASSLEDALDKVAAGPPQLVLVDRDLPGAVGLIEKLRRRRDTRDASIAIVVRGDIGADERSRLQEIADEVLAGPGGTEWDGQLGRLLVVARRHDARVPVRLEFSGFVGGSRARVTGIAHNISLSGMLVECVMPLPAGGSVRFRLTLPRNKSEISGRGSVVREQPPSPTGVTAYGVRFEEMDPESRQKLRDFVEA